MFLFVKICTLIALVLSTKGWLWIDFCRGRSCGTTGKIFHPYTKEAARKLSGEIRNEGKGALQIVLCNNVQSKFRGLQRVNRE